MTAIPTGWTRSAQPHNRTGAFRSARNWLRRQVVVRHNCRVLHALSDNELKDIGIPRGSIFWISADLIDHARRPRGPYPF